MTTTVAELNIRAAGYLHRACPHCGWRFFTTLALSEHARTCLEDQAHRVHVRERLRETGLAVTALNNSRRVRCTECGKVSTPSGIALHQMKLGHTGRIDVS